MSFLMVLAVALGELAFILVVLGVTALTIKNMLHSGSPAKTYDVEIYIANKHTEISSKSPLKKLG